MPDLSLNICICTNRPMPPRFVLSYGLMLLRLATVPDPFRKIGVYMGEKTSNLSIGRELAVAHTLKGGFTHMLFLDDDMAFPADLAHRLASHDKRIVAVNCARKALPPSCTAEDLDGVELSSKGRQGLQEVSRIGFGMMLIDMRVFEEVSPPRFAVPWIDQRTTSGKVGYMTEDTFFCSKMRQSGERIYIDHDLSHQCGHVGDFVYTIPT